MKKELCECGNPIPLTALFPMARCLRCAYAIFKSLGLETDDDEIMKWIKECEATAAPEVLEQDD